MKYLIIEDEHLAQEELVRMLKSLDPNFELLASLYSVNESIEWLKNNAQPDIIFMDIHLSDNICFDIFDKVKVTVPAVVPPSVVRTISSAGKPQYFSCSLEINNAS